VKITRQIISDFIDALDVSDGVKRELKELAPQNYTGK
jgi:hypothetical protein